MSWLEQQYSEQTFEQITSVSQEDIVQRLLTDEINRLKGELYIKEMKNLDLERQLKKK